MHFKHISAKFSLKAETCSLLILSSERQHSIASSYPLLWLCPCISHCYILFTGELV